MGIQNYLAQPPDDPIAINSPHFTMSLPNIAKKRLKKFASFKQNAMMLALND